MYGLLRPFLFGLDPEQAHRFTLRGLELIHRAGLSSLLAAPVPSGPAEAMGLSFPNPVGLAAGLDKNGEHIDALGALGFGFIEIGTVTPRPQPGNPRPRMFRLPAANALINRLGFNNEGVDTLVRNVRRASYRGILGINIGKNYDTPIAEAGRDYLFCLERVYPYASYVTVNISSPNTQDLRQLQGEDALDGLLASLMGSRDRLAQASGRHVPLAVKIAPDLSDAEIATIAALLLAHRVDAVIATNTTISREAVQGLPHAEEAGGLSGAPVFAASNRVIRQLARELQGRIPIIGVGGVLTGADAREKLAAGASLMQVYTGLIYRGPGLIAEILRELKTGRME